MKNIRLTGLIALSLAACNNGQPGAAASDKDNAPAAPAMAFLAPPASALISLDSANKMIGSYVSSVQSGEQGSANVKSFIIDANTLRDYLNSDNGKSITKMKISLGHTLDYINRGAAGRPCGYQNGALTILLSGIDQNGDYVFYKNQVLDHAMPCPTACPVSGSAQNDLLMQ